MRQIVAVLLVLCVPCPAVAGIVEYEMIDLGTLPGAPHSEAFSINESNQIVGFSGGHPFLHENGVMNDLGFGGIARDVNDAGMIVGGYFGIPGEAFLYEDGAVTDLGTLGGTTSEAKSINAAGQIVGQSSISPDNNYEHAFLYENGSMVDLGTLGGNYSYANSINNAGQLVGSSATSAGVLHGYLYEGGTMTDLGTLGGETSQAYAINDAGWIVGTADVAAGENHAFLYQDGTMTDLGTLGELDSAAFGLNEQGQVVGYVRTPGYKEAFLYQNGEMYGLGLLPGGSLSEAWDINEAGWIVGIADGPAPGPRHAVLWVPIPEPTSGLLLLLAWIGVSRPLRRRLA